MSKSTDTQNSDLLAWTNIGAAERRICSKTSTHHRTSLVRSDVIWDLEDELLVNTAV